MGLITGFLISKALSKSFFSQIHMPAMSISLITRNNLRDPLAKKRFGDSKWRKSGAPLTSRHRDCTLHTDDFSSYSTINNYATKMHRGFSQFLTSFANIMLLLLRLPAEQIHLRGFFHVPFPFPPSPFFGRFASFGWPSAESSASSRLPRTSLARARTSFGRPARRATWMP